MNTTPHTTPAEDGFYMPPGTLLDGLALPSGRLG